MPSAPRGEVNLSTFMLLLLLCAGGLAVANYAGARFGILGFLLGFVAGFVALLFILYGLMLALACGIGLFTGIPLLPPCGNGKCKAGLVIDYGDYDFEQVEGESAYRCRCGRRYIHRRKERRVLEMLPDGSLKPYMVWKPFRGWRADCEEARQSEE